MGQPHTLSGCRQGCRRCPWVYRKEPVMSASTLDAWPLTVGVLDTSEIALMGVAAEAGGAVAASCEGGAGDERDTERWNEDTADAAGHKTSLGRSHVASPTRFQGDDPIRAHRPRDLDLELFPRLFTSRTYTAFSKHAGRRTDDGDRPRCVGMTSGVSTGCGHVPMTRPWSVRPWIARTSSMSSGASCSSRSPPCSWRSRSSSPRVDGRVAGEGRGRS